MSRKPDTGADITRLLKVWSEGDERAFEQLILLVYGELHRMALRYLRGEQRHVSLQATALVNEVCLRLLGWNGARWQNRGHFFGVSAGMMRRVLVDIARRRRADRRGGDGTVRVALDGIDVAMEEPDEDLVALHDALTGWLSRMPGRRGWSSSGSSVGCRWKKPLRPWVSHCARSTATGRSPAHGSIER